jgi:putative tryptophan/tyrosine transport system substrate-binding protein
MFRASGKAMRRREFITLLGGAAAALPVLAHGQTRAKTLRIGVLWHAGSAEEEAIYLGALREGLSDVGVVEGRNIILENRFPAETPERFVSLATELAALKVDVLIAVTRAAALAAQRATTTIPIIFVIVPDPLGDKLVESLAHPGGNITGLSNFALDLTAKRVEFLKTVVPSVSRVALLVNPNDKVSSEIYIRESRSAADKLGLFLQPVEIRTPADLAPAFAKMGDEQINGVVVTQDGLFYATRKDVADLALARRLPLAMYTRETADAGALASYGPSHYRMFRRVGYYVDKILKGTKPADLPVEQPTKFEFIINLRTARALGLTVSPAVLARADDVID